MEAKPLENLECFLLGRLEHVDLLKAPGQGAIAIERLLHVVERGRADTPELSAGERRLQQVPGIHGAAGRRTRAHERVDLIDEEDRVVFLREPIEHLLDALLEVTAITRSGDQRTQVEREDTRPLQHLGDLVLVDAQRQPFG